MESWARPRSHVFMAKPLDVGFLLSLEGSRSDAVLLAAWSALLRSSRHFVTANPAHKSPLHGEFIIPWSRALPTRGGHIYRLASGE